MAKGHEQEPHPGECKTEQLHRVASKAAADSGPDVRVAVCELLPAEAPCGYSIGASSTKSLLHTTPCFPQVWHPNAGTIRHNGTIE
jgi:hypothetical protein